MRLSFALVAFMAAINTLALPVSEVSEVSCGIQVLLPFIEQPRQRSEGTTADKFMAWGFEDVSARPLMWQMQADSPACARRNAARGACTSKRRRGRRR